MPRAMILYSLYRGIQVVGNKVAMRDHKMRPAQPRLLCRVILCAARQQCTCTSAVQHPDEQSRNEHDEVAVHQSRV